MPMPPKIRAHGNQVNDAFSLLDCTHNESYQALLGSQQMDLAGHPTPSMKDVADPISTGAIGSFHRDGGIAVKTTVRETGEGNLP